MLHYRRFVFGPSHLLLVTSYMFVSHLRCLLWPLISPLCFQGGFEMGRLLHAGCRTHPAGLLLLHRVPPAGGADSKDSEPAAGEQDQAAAEYAAGKSFTVVID